MDEILSKISYLHIVGIGGAGTSGIALLLKDKGLNISGSDIKESDVLTQLRKEGIKVFLGHQAKNLPSSTQLVSYSSAVSLNNPEILEAKRRGVPIIKRGELLGQIVAGKKAIAIAGSHGKTTVSALISHLLTALGYQPSVFVGGLPLNYSQSAWWGKDYFVIETDESDGSFLKYYPWASIITNIDYEHLDYYKNFDNLRDSFLLFGRQTKEVVCGCGDEPPVKRIINELGGITYGFNKDNRLRAKISSFDGKFYRFGLFIDGKYIRSVRSPLLGKHNILNVLAALSFFFHINENLEKVTKLLKSFKGTKRRFQVKAQLDGVTFVDDYAHHPTEIKMVLKAARSLKPKRLLVIFEPHRFSRLKLLAEEFSGAFFAADRLVVTDICSAHEEEIEGINSEFVLKKIKEKFPGPISYIPQDKLAQRLCPHFEAGDLVIGLGAGSINLAMQRIVDEFKKVRIRA